MEVAFDMNFEMTTYLIEDDGSLRRRYDIHHDDINVAYALLRPLSTEGDGPWLSGLYVKPSYRKQGLATLLFDEIEKDHRDQVLRCKADPYKDKGVSQETLISIYKNQGFTSYDPDDPTRLMKIAGKE